MADELFENVQLLSPAELQAAKARGTIKTEGEPAPTSEEGGEPTPPNKDGELGVDIGDGIRMLTPADMKRLKAEQPEKFTTPDSEEEGEEQPEGGVKPTETSEGSKGKPVETQVQKVANVLSNLGLLTVPDDAVLETEEDIRRIFQDNIRNLSEAQYQSWIDTLPEQSKRLVGLLDDGVAEESAIRLSTQKTFIESIGESSSEEDFEAAYRLRLKYQGMETKEIDELVQIAKDTDKLKEKGLEAKTKLSTSLEGEEAAEKQRVIDEENAARERQRQYAQTLEANIEAKQEIIPGVKLTPQMKKKLTQSFFTPVGEVNGQPVNQVAEMRSRNPQEFDLMLHYLVQTGVINIDAKTKQLKPNTDVFKRQATTKATESLLDIATHKETEVTEGEGRKPGGLRSFVDVMEGKI